MVAFPERADDYALVFQEDTDKPLPEKPMPGTRYAYFKTIARGGKCIIQSCKDMHLGRVICYKKLRPELADDPLEQRRFVREARVSAMLQHPNTVPTYELGRDTSGHHYFTMKLVHGYTLREILDFRDRYDFSQLVDVVIGVAQALEYAHTHRVLHRDIKPENILAGPYGEYLLLDWGLAKVWMEDQSEDTDDPPAGGASNGRSDQMGPLVTGHGALQGTVTYMSPEQLRRDPNIDLRTDIFSLGVILYEILAGRPPTESDVIHEIIEEIAEVVPPPPSKVTSARVPELLETITMRCLAKDPDDRVPSCGELIRLLREDW